MATLKACVQKMRNDGFFPVYIRVTHNTVHQDGQDGNEA